MLFIPKGAVLITGSSDFIGSHVVAEAIKNGYKVKGLDIADPKQNCGLEFVRADIRDKKAVSDAMEG